MEELRGAGEKRLASRSASWARDLAISWSSRVRSSDARIPDRFSSLVSCSPASIAVFIVSSLVTEVDTFRTRS